MIKIHRVIFYLAVLFYILADNDGNVYAAADGDICIATNQFTCPTSCSGTVLDCLECDGYFNTDMSHSICFDRKLFGSHKEKDPDLHYPYLVNDIIGALVWFLAAGVATACGVGGGGIYVPLGIILLRFASKPATGLSQASIFGASLGGLILNIQNQHPDTKIRDTIGVRDENGKVIPYDIDKSMAQVKADEEAYLNSGRKFYSRPLIDYDMALFLAPMEMAGAVMGVMIQKLLPNWLFLSLAGLVLAFTSFKTYQKFFSSYQQDKENRERKRLANMQSETECGGAKEGSKHEGFIVKSIDVEDGDGRKERDLRLKKDKADANIDKKVNPNVNLKTEVEENDEEDAEKLKLRQKILQEDSRQHPNEKIFYLIILWIGLAFIIFLKGGKGVDSIVGVTCKSPWYAILIACQFLWTLGFATLFGIKLVKRHEEKVTCDYPFHTNDVLWDAKKLSFYAFFTFVAGVVAGLIGIGGGMVLGPLMLIMGIHPRVSSATTATMIVLTSSSVAVMFVTSGLVPWEYATFFFCICFLGAYIGKKYIDQYVKKTGMASILIGILATIIGLATVGCFVIVLLNLHKANWCFDGFKKFCTQKGDDDLECIIDELLS